MGRKYGAVYALFLLCLCLARTLPGQNITGTLVGQISDSLGATIEGAHITVSNTETGIVTVGISGSSGSFSIPGIQPGTYTVVIEASSFESYKQSGVVLASAQTSRVDAKLSVGAQSVTVEVKSSNSLLSVDSASIESRLDAKQISGLPSAYQNITSLYATIPGAPATGSASNPRFAGSSYWGGTNYSLNGVSVDDANNGGAAYAYATSDNTSMGLANLPPLDTLQEFRAVTVNANAEFRNMASVMMITKQGTNKFHGGAYEYFQNAYLNANTYLRNATALPRLQNNLNQFGGTIGGPILRNKAFFFFSPVFLRKITAGQPQLTLPSAAMAQGNFSALLAQGTQLYNPFTGSAFAGNQIPTSMFSSQARTLLTYLPAPTTTTSSGLPSGNPNYFASVPVRNSMDSYTARADYQINASDSIFGFYMGSTGKPWEVFLGGPAQYGNASNYGFRDQVTGLAEQHVFSPTALNDFRVAFFIHTNYRQGENEDFDPSTLFPQLTPGTNRGLPTMTVSGYSSLFNDVGYGLNKRGFIKDLEFTDNFTKVINNHVIKMGFDETGYKSFAKWGTGSLGSFAFTGVWTGNRGRAGQPQSQGNAFADFLLGTANSASRSTISPDVAKYSRDYEFYAQDTWQATPRLTLYYGLRYMYQTPWSVAQNARSLYDVARNKIALPQDGTTPTLPALANASLFNSYLPYFETTQSIGLSKNYMNSSKRNWGPRVGFAYRPYPNTVLRGGYGLYYSFIISAFGSWDAANLPFGSNTVTASSALTSTAAGFQPDITFANPFGSSSASIPLNPTLYYVQPDLKNTDVQQFNLSLEHQLPGRWSTRASYVGSVTHHLPWYQSDINVPYVQTPNATIQAQRLNQPWSTISSIRSGGNQNFNQLQLEAIHRSSNGNSVQVEYSWTRSLDNVEISGNPQRWYLPRDDYGNSTGLRTHSLLVNYVYELPFGNGKALLSGRPRFVNDLVGGWQMSGVTTYATGAPFSVAFSVPSSYIGWLGGRASLVPGVNPYVRASGHNVVQGVQWFNPAAFGPPQPWTWGNSGRNILWGPGLWNWDMSLMKQIAVPGDQVKVTLRADFLNAFNHFNLSNPAATVASTQYGGVAVATAGKIVSGSGNRSVQLGLRVSF